jgi:predicted nucleic acid-binding protein
MAIVYFDSSALVKLVLDEPGSDIVDALWNGCDAALSSRLAHPEVCAALAASGRNHDLRPTEVDAALADWTRFWSSMRAVELSAPVAENAASLSVLHGLRGADAVHLASALAADTPDLVVAVWDRRLHAGALAVGLRVAPASLD